MRTSWRVAGLIAVFGAAISMTAVGDPIPSWEETNPAVSTIFWGYNFNDGLIPPTVTLEGGCCVLPTDPIFYFSGTGDGPSIVAGQLGINNATQNTEMDILIRVPNDYNASAVKTFWFAYDCFGAGSEIPTAGTTNLNHTVSGITYTANTVGNHIEAYITIDPQPQDEWLNIHLSAAVGESVVIDNLMVGSSCIPEPSSVVLVAFGGLIMLRARKGLQRNRADSDPQQKIRWDKFFTTTVNY